VTVGTGCRVLIGMDGGVAVGRGAAAASIAIRMYPAARPVFVLATR